MQEAGLLQQRAEKLSHALLELKANFANAECGRQQLEVENRHLKRENGSVRAHHEKVKCTSQKRLQDNKHALRERVAELSAHCEALREELDDVQRVNEKADDLAKKLLRCQLGVTYELVTVGE